MKTPQFSAIGAAFCVAALLATPARAAVQDIQSLVSNGRYAEAITMADADLSAQPKDAQTRFLKGIALAEMNRADDAIVVFKQLTEDYPELPEPYNNLAVLYAQQRHFEKARSALEMAIRTHPSYATAHENLGDVYARLASQAYNQALQIDSANSAAQSKLALIRQLMTVSAPSGAATVVASAPSSANMATPPQPARNIPVAAMRPRPVAETPLTDEAPAPAAPAPASPSPAPAPAVTVATAAPPPPAVAARDDAHQAVRDTVQAWARAWSDKDVAAYLAFYTPDFRPPNGVSHNTWKAQREQRVGGKVGQIDVELADIEITTDGETASAIFRQHYRSSGFSGSTDKTLKLVTVDGRWRIRQELIGHR